VGELKDWFRQQKMYHKDHLLVTVEDWERGMFRLEREAFGKQQPEQIRERNELVANMLYTILDSARIEYVFLFNAIPTLYARLPDKTGCPPDHWRYILRDDERMKTDGFDIRYAESHTLWDDGVSLHALKLKVARVRPGPWPRPDACPVGSRSRRTAPLGCLRVGCDPRYAGESNCPSFHW
jgi:hypothetical protein